MEHGSAGSRCHNSRHDGHALAEPLAIFHPGLDLMPRGESEFVEQVLNMGLGRLLGDAPRGRDLAIAQALHDQARDLALAQRQQAQPGIGFRTSLAPLCVGYVFSNRRRICGSMVE